MQYSRKFVQARFERVAKAVGWNISQYRDDAGSTVIGYTSLDFISTWGGYYVTQIMNYMGGETIINPGPRMSGREICCWLDGIMYAREHLPAHLERYAMKQAEYYKG